MTPTYGFKAKLTRTFQIINGYTSYVCGVIYNFPKRLGGFWVGHEHVIEKLMWHNQWINKCETTVNRVSGETALRNKIVPRCHVITPIQISNFCWQLAWQFFLRGRRHVSAICRYLHVLVVVVLPSQFYLVESN